MMFSATTSEFEICRPAPTARHSPRTRHATREFSRTAGQTAWASPPPTQIERFTYRVMWALAAVAFLRVFGLDLAYAILRAVL